MQNHRYPTDDSFTMLATQSPKLCSDTKITCNLKFNKKKKLVRKLVDLLHTNTLRIKLFSAYFCARIALNAVTVNYYKCHFAWCKLFKKQ